MALPFIVHPIKAGLGDLRRDADHALVVRAVNGGTGGSGAGFAYPNSVVVAPAGMFQGAVGGFPLPWALQKVLGTAPTPNTFLQFIISAALPTGGETPELSLPAYPKVDYEIGYPFGLQFSGANPMWIGWSNTPGEFTIGPFGSFRAIFSTP